MNVVEYLQNLADQGIKLRVEGERLRCQGPKERITPTLVAQLQQQKDTILPWLQQRQQQQMPLSYSQQAYWRTYQQEPTSAEGNLSVVATLEPELKLVALEQALQDVLMRHPLLRTTYHIRPDGTPYGQIEEALHLGLQVIDATGWSTVHLQQQVETETSRPFDLQQSVIRAIVLLRTSPTARYSVVYPDEQRAMQLPLLILMVHHIAIDALAFSVLLNDLCTCYAARKNGEQPQLSSLPLDYRDFVRWEADCWQVQQTPLTAYWRQQLRAPLPTFHLPEESLRTQLSTGVSHSYNFALSPTLTQQLKGFAHTQGVTFYAILLATFATLLHKYTNQSEFLLLMPVNRRELIEFTGVIGDFSNQVLIRLDLAGNPTFTTLLTQTQAVLLAALEHQGYPFPLLIEQQDAFEPDRTRLDRLCFAFSPPLIPLPQDGLLQEILDYCKVYSQGTDLLLFMTEREDTASGYFIYHSDLFRVTTIEQMVTYFQTLLTTLVANPHIPINSLRQPTVEKQQLSVHPAELWQHS